MSRRPTIDLAAITAEAAAPMTEATQRAAPHPIVPPAERAGAQSTGAKSAAESKTKTADLQPLAFKVPPAFRKRFRQHAANADLKLNELLFEALAAWEEKRGLGGQGGQKNS